MNCRLTAASALALLLIACADEPTRRVENVRTSGFLADYSILQRGQEGEAALIYRNPSINIGQYTKVLLEPVTVWLASDSNLKRVEPAQRQQLADAFHAALRSELSKTYSLVQTAEPGTMRIRVALTDASPSNQVLDTISSFVPQAFVMSQVTSLASDTATFVGEASAEGEIRDAVTGVLIAAGVDRRAGVKSYGRTVATWGDAKNAFEAWAAQLNANLKAGRGFKS